MSKHKDQHDEQSLEENFFATQTPSSRTKATIISDYFPQYCRIIMKPKPQKVIRYLDLFAGPGKYDDGNWSTPLLLAHACAKDGVLRKVVHLLFNDMAYAKELEVNFLEHFPSGTFTNEPRFGSEIVGQSEKITDYLSRAEAAKNERPTLLFIDPWGYKGIDTLILTKFLSNWGNELFLFVNTKRINAAIDNDKFDNLMNTLFPTTIGHLRKDKKYGATVTERVKLIIDNLALEFQKGVKVKLYSCAFRFQEEDNTGTSHFIVHFTKHKRGYELIKQIYYDYDNIGATLINGVYTFDAKRLGDSGNSSLDFGDQNIQILAKELKERYARKVLTARALFDQHNHGTQWCATHYSLALRALVEQGKLKSSFTDNVKHKVAVTITEHCKLEFV